MSTSTADIAPSAQACAFSVHVIVDRGRKVKVKIKIKVNEGLFYVPVLSGVAYVTAVVLVVTSWSS